MAVEIKPKRTSTPSKVPTTSDLSDGELAVNTADQKIYVRDGMSIVEVASVGGGGGGSGMVLKQQVFTSSGTFTLPSTALPLISYLVRGGGGAGGGVGPSGGTATTASAGGGGGGGYREGMVNMTPGTSVAVLVGAGGVGSAAGGGTSGGTSSIAGVVECRGGAGGAAGLTPDAAGQGGASGDGVLPLVANAALGYVPFRSTSGQQGSINSAAASAPSFSGECIGGGGGMRAAVTPAPPGAGSGGSAPSPSSGQNGFAATIVGCGGGGAARNATNVAYAGGNGFRGQVDIRYWDVAP